MPEFYLLAQSRIYQTYELAISKHVIVNRIDCKLKWQRIVKVSVTVGPRVQMRVLANVCEHRRGWLQRREARQDTSVSYFSVTLPPFIVSHQIWQLDRGLSSLDKMASVHLGGPLFPGSPRNKGDLAVVSLIFLPDRVSPFLSFCEASLRVDTVRLYTYVHSKAVACVIVKNLEYILTAGQDIQCDSQSLCDSRYRHLTILDIYSRYRLLLSS